MKRMAVQQFCSLFLAVDDQDDENKDSVQPLNTTAQHEQLEEIVESIQRALHETVPSRLRGALNGWPCTGSTIRADCAMDMLTLLYYINYALEIADEKRFPLVPMAGIRTRHMAMDKRSLHVLHGVSSHSQTPLESYLDLHKLGLCNKNGVPTAKGREWTILSLSTDGVSVSCRLQRKTIADKKQHRRLKAAQTRKRKRKREKEKEDEDKERNCLVREREKPR